MKPVYRIAALLSLLLWTPRATAQQEMDLSGTWEFETDVMDFRRAGVEMRGDDKLHSTITLPGITDAYGIGYPTPYKYLDRLTRKYEYMAPAWYRRHVQVPAEWEGKLIRLYLERAHWLTAVYDGRKEVSRQDYLTVPHVHDLTGYLKAGQSNIIDLLIDNRYQYDTHKWNHMHTEFTQINWNGAIGDIKLIALDSVYVDNMQIYPDIRRKQIMVRLDICNATGRAVKGEVHFAVSGPEVQVEKTVAVAGADSVLHLETPIALGAKARLWDEFTPNLYQVDCTLRARGTGEFSHRLSENFGLREVRAKGEDILLNGHRLHLRGTVNNAEFPLTGHVPMDEASWERIFRILKDYGMNHMRFHSWCPPEACFRMADRMGVYLEVEMPMWGSDAQPGNEARNDFFRRELRALLRAYGNHPSFVLYCNGNELEGDFDFLNELTAYGVRTDNRRLYTGSTARRHVASEQFYVSHRSDKGGVTIYEGRPHTDWDINAGHGTGQPIISHETGQRCVYPDFREMSRYTGPVEARNLELYRDSLQAHGMADLADDFFRVTGQQTRIEYKDVIEGQLRSSLSSGFQLLSLIDFPGQGYAPVGILNALWESKGIISPEKFREFCAPTVPLLRFPKRAFYNDETFTAKAEVYNYSPAAFRNPRLRWTVTDEQGRTLFSGRLKAERIGTYGVFPAGSFSFPLHKVPANSRLTVRLELDGRAVNSWDIWVYARRDVKELLKSTPQVLFTTAYTAQARQYLQQGKTVVLLPRPDRVKGRRSNFHNHFWNPVMFKWQPLTLGCLVHKEQPVLADFNTDSNLDWQWWDILTNAKVIEMDAAPDALRPFLQPIDTYQHNHKLGIGFEARVGQGNLLVLAVDVEKNIGERPATLQLLQSVRNYVLRGGCRPTVEIGEDFLRSFLDLSHINESPEAVQDDFLNSFQNK